MSYGPFTIAIILITVLISIPAMNDERLVNKLILWPNRMNSPREYYRLLSSGFIHANWPHLIFNMIALFSFGTVVEYLFASFSTPWLYAFMYLSAIVVASLPSYIKNKRDPNYRALGASGGVSAILFSSVYFGPWQQMYVYFFKLPSIVFAVIYLGYSIYMSKKGNDNIGHDAHFFGALYGLIFTLIADPSHGQIFLMQIMHPHF